MARTTISIPKELKEKMTILGSSVNWSQVACDAFKQKIAGIEAKKDMVGYDLLVSEVKQIQMHHPTRQLQVLAEILVDALTEIDVRFKKLEMAPVLDQK